MTRAGRGRCLGTGTSMGGVGGASGRERKTTCPECGRKVGMRPGRAGRLYPHDPDAGTPAERLTARLRVMLAVHGVELPPSARCVRQYTPGERANGAWSWFVEADEEVPDIGSQWPMREVLAASSVTVSGVWEQGRRVWHVDVGERA